MKLEASIREVHQLFMDMAIMVEQQGEMLDNIEELVSKSAEVAICFLVLSRTC